jgi:hypothetical protein
MSTNRYTISVDFDGVIHSYKSPWKAVHIIPDDPVEGALEWLCAMGKKFDIAITSTRCKTWRGRRAMKSYLRQQYRKIGALHLETIPEWLMKAVCEDHHAGPWDQELEHAIDRILSKISFPKHKPPALIYLDDRAYRFTGPGSFPTPDQVHASRPWNKP